MSHKKYRQDKNCLNCSAEVPAKFCSNCGQENLETHEVFVAVAGHFLSDYFHYDSKFFRSLIPIFTKPGFLTNEYWEGRRIRYIHPLRMYFFITILFMVSAICFYEHMNGRITKSFYETTITLNHEDSVAIAKAPDKAKAVEAMHGEQKAKLDQAAAIGADRFFHHLKYISFFLLPVYALIFSILFRRQRKFYVDHIVYTLHLQSFAYIFISLVLFIALLFPDSLVLIRRLTIFSIFVYMAISLRFLYQQKWWKIIVKSLVATLLLFMSMGLTLGLYLLYFIVKVI